MFKFLLSPNFKRPFNLNTTLVDVQGKITDFGTLFLTNLNTTLVDVQGSTFFNWKEVYFI